MIEGISHITFIVKDLDLMERFLVQALAAEKVYDSGDTTFSISQERFFMIGGQWIATMCGEPLSRQSYNHVAFKISDGDYQGYLRRIKSLGVKVREGRSRVEGEGQSIYFYDYDNHLFELHTGTLSQRLERYEQGK